MMELHVVKGPAEERFVLENDEANELGHGCKVMLHLLQFLTSAKCHIVCADSYFASVQAACCLFDFNFQFIGVVKTAMISEDIFGQGGVAHLWDCGGIDSSS
jgi:hypothetical protein